ncbi:MAG: EAL domain-containing protein, partial [Spirochaetales bacterium]|nr:EAL domain-containing protein [Spirochaetales bacterium]
RPHLASDAPPPVPSAPLPQAAPAPVPAPAPSLLETAQALASAELKQKAAEAEVADLKNKNAELKVELKRSRAQEAAPWWPAALGLTLALIAVMIVAFGLLVLSFKKRIVRERRAQQESVQNLVKDTESRLLQKAVHDELTGLPNRAALNQTLGHAVTKARRYNRKLAVLFIDLDHFKPINDSLGHEAGDFVLKTIAERFRSCLRSTDMVARLGGDEFVVLVEDIVDQRFLGGVTQKLLSAAQGAFNVAGQEVHVSASIGIAFFPQDGREAQTLLKNADAAMYKAKESGRNSFQYYCDEQNTHSLERQALAASIGHALSSGELSVVYQPIIGLGAGQPLSFEALVRWHHKDLGNVLPHQFIPLAEDAGLFEPIHDWIVLSALKKGLEGRSAGQVIGVNVNVTDHTFYSPQWVSHLRESLEKTQFPPEKLTLEITEETLLMNPDEALEILQTLKSLGVLLLLDNFGVGWASLSSLKRFPLDAVKLDKSLLGGVPGETDAENMLLALLGAARQLEITTIVVGVETAAQKAFLEKAQCPWAQGFFFGQPQS